MRNFFLLVFCAMTLQACAHSYYYLPEIKGKGAMHADHGGIVYSVPPTAQPEFKLYVRSLGIHKIKDRQMIAIRLIFIRPHGVSPKSHTQEFLRVNEQTLLFGDLDLKPVYVHTKSKHAEIELTNSPKEVVDFLYRLPQDSRGAEDIDVYKFQWSIHYGLNKAESQITRFDRNDSAPQQLGASLFPEDNDYPYDVSPTDVPGWTVEHDPFWWAADPWGPVN